MIIMLSDAASRCLRAWDVWGPEDLIFTEGLYSDDPRETFLADAGIAVVTVAPGPPMWFVRMKKVVLPPCS